MGDLSARSSILNRLGCALFALGQERSGTEVLQEAIEVARRADSNDDLATGFLNYADSLHLAGRSAEAIEVAAEGAAEIAGNDRSNLSLAATRVEILFESGRWDEARDLLPSRRTASAGSSLVNVNLRRADLALGAGDDAAAQPLIDEAQKVLADSVEPQHIAAMVTARAELARRAGDLRAAQAAIDEGLDRIEYCSDDAARLAKVALSGLTVEADAAQRACDLGDAAAEGEALARAEVLHARVEAAAETVAGRPVEQAYLVTAEAELARARGDGMAPAAAAAADAWDALGRPYPAAVARWREAEALVAAGDRDQAARAAAASLAAAAGSVRFGSRTRSVPLRRGPGCASTTAPAPSATASLSRRHPSGSPPASARCWRWSRPAPPTARSAIACSWPRRPRASTFRGSSASSTSAAAPRRRRWPTVTASPTSARSRRAEQVSPQ